MEDAGNIEMEPIGPDRENPKVPEADSDVMNDSNDFSEGYLLQRCQLGLHRFGELPGRSPFRFLPVGGFGLGAHQL